VSSALNTVCVLAEVDFAIASLMYVVQEAAIMLGKDDRRNVLYIAVVPVHVSGRFRNDSLLEHVCIGNVVALA
jgi:hypothetical protein